VIGTHRSLARPKLLHLSTQRGVLHPQRSVVHSRLLVGRAIGHDDTLPNPTPRSTRHADDHVTPAPPATTRTPPPLATPGPIRRRMTVDAPPVYALAVARNVPPR
jgi:hypothetical protein